MFTPSDSDWPQIEGKPLEPVDRGRLVAYHPVIGKVDIGVLSSYRPDGTIFIRFRGPRAERCEGHNLTWHPPATKGTN